MGQITPGEWVNMPDGPFWGEIRSAETFDLIAVMPELDDRTADFELIAAAPDLLAACEAALEAFEFSEYSDKCDCLDCTAQRKLRAAIAKARGGADEHTPR